jgi:hypothetical protein
LLRAQKSILSCLPVAHQGKITLRSKGIRPKEGISLNHLPLKLDGFQALRNEERGIILLENLDPRIERSAPSKHASCGELVKSIREIRHDDWRSENLTTRRHHLRIRVN